MDDSSVRVYGTTGGLEEHAGDRGRQMLANVRNKLGDVHLKSWVEEHPLPATLAALGLGVVAAMVVTPRRRDPYDKLEHRLKKVMKGVTRVKHDADDEIEHLKDAFKSAEQQQHAAEKRAHAAEKELGDLRDHPEALAGMGGKPGGSSWRALLVSAVGAQLVHLLTRWVSNRMLTDREPGEGDDRMGGYQHEPSEYMHTPPI